MKFLFLLFVTAVALMAQPYPKVNAPDDVRVLVYQANAGACQIVEAYQMPCAQHVTVMLFPHSYDTPMYKVTMRYRQWPYKDENQTWVKNVIPTDHEGMVSVTYLLSYIDILEVTIEKIGVFPVTPSRKVFDPNPRR